MIRSSHSVDATGRHAALGEEADPSEFHDLTEHANGTRPDHRPTGPRPAEERPSSRPGGDSGARRYRFLAKAIPQIVWTASTGGSLDSFNPRWLEYTGRAAGHSDDHGWREALHPDDVPRWLDGWARSRGSGSKLLIDLRLRRADGEYRWHLVHALPVLDRSGKALKWMGTCTDIDDQKRAEGVFGFLAEVGAVLASSLDYETTLSAVARMAVPHVADWCAVDMLEADGSTRRLALAHLDPTKVVLAWERARRLPASLGDPEMALRVLRSGRTEFAVEVEDGASADPDVDPDDPDDPDDPAALGDRGCTSAICAPLAARGRTLGVITFAMAESGRRYSPSDLPLVEDLARRAGLAVDNARLYREARQAREEAEAANRAKDRFLAVLSHELRTPLTPVLAEVSGLLDDAETPEALRPALEMTRRNVELTARLIDDLLDLNRIVQGKLRLDRAVVDVHQLILQALQICQPGVEENGLRVEVALEAGRRHVEGDAARLQQVLWNLIRNAVKFTPSGGFVAIRTRDDGPRLVVEVSDTGIGIAPDVLPRIFDAFEQGGPAVTQQFGGLGLGLAISRSLVEANRGRLLADSPGPGQGATFTLELPAVDPPADPTALDPRRRADPAPPSRILLVEDNADTLQVMARLLRRKGHRVATAAGVAEAIRAAGAEDFDLLISDLGLPDGSGLDLPRRLSEARTAPDPIPAIALSGFGMEDDVRRSREAGFAEHLTKPIDIQAIEDAIARVATAHQVRA